MMAPRSRRARSGPAVPWGTSDARRHEVSHDGWGHVAESALTDMLGIDAVRRVRALLAERPDAVVILGDTDGRLLWASAPGSEGLFGRRPESFQGDTRFDYVHPDDVGRARRAFARALEGETVRYQVRALTAGGAWRRVTSVTWCVDGPRGRGVVTITTSDDPHVLAWPSTTDPQ